MSSPLRETILITNALSFQVMAKKQSFKIPGVTFSWSRALGVDQAKRQVARQTGIPTTKAGLERKIGRTLLKSFSDLFK